MRLALYQPDIPQNTGTILRMAACLNIGVDIIGPTGFDMSARALRRAGLDYLPYVNLVRHQSYEHFDETRQTSQARLILLSTKAKHVYTEFAFQAGDVLMLGRESAGVPDEIHQAANHRVLIPMAGNMRSMNIAMSAAMVLGEALRQTGLFPEMS